MQAVRYSEYFLKAFMEGLRATVSFVMSARTEQLGPHWTDLLLFFFFNQF